MATLEEGINHVEQEAEMARLLAEEAELEFQLKATNVMEV